MMIYVNSDYKPREQVKNLSITYDEFQKKNRLQKYNIYTSTLLQVKNCKNKSYVLQVLSTLCNYDNTLLLQVLKDLKNRYKQYNVYYELIKNI